MDQQKKIMCTRLTPYRCPKCGHDLLFFVSESNRNRLIDYKNLMDRCYSLQEIKEFLYKRADIEYLKCLSCNKMYIIDWSRGYPIPLISKSDIEKFGY